MKYLLFALSLTGCATAIPYTSYERCAQDGMALRGMDKASNSGMAFTDSGNTVQYSSRGTNLRCEMPNSPEEKAQIEALRRELTPKEEYNSDIGEKVLLTGLGYYLFIIPGIIAKTVYDGERDEAIEKSNAIAAQNRAVEREPTEHAGTNPFGE